MKNTMIRKFFQKLQFFNKPTRKTEHKDLFSWVIEIPIPWMSNSTPRAEINTYHTPLLVRSCEIAVIRNSRFYANAFLSCRPEAGVRMR